MLERLYRSLYRIRRLEEEVARVYPTDKIKSPVHLSIGQEAVSVGICQALAPQDVVFGTYRGHALYLAKGGELVALFAELLPRLESIELAGPAEMKATTFVGGLKHLPIAYRLSALTA